MLEPKKPGGEDQPTTDPAKPAEKEYNPTPAEGSPDFTPGTLDPNNPNKE